MDTPPHDHRPWPAPTRPWTMAMQWHDLLFAHWPIAPEALRPLVPAGLALDTFDGEAWVGAIPFMMRGVRPRLAPPLPGLAAFAEVNLRTYVVAGGKPGVWFFSLDAASAPAVAIARRWFHLPYFNAEIARSPGPAGGLHYCATRTHFGAPPAVFNARYRPTGPAHHALPGTLEYWLVERYCLYASTPEGALFRGEIDHAPWPLQPAEAEIIEDTLALSQGLILPRVAPLLHYAARLDVHAWSLDRLPD